MIAVVYSGSRYANWKLAERGKVLADFKTEGINPYLSDSASIVNLLNNTNELITYAEKIKRIYFFGAGASSPQRQEIVHSAFTEFFRFGKTVVEHDLKAAAIATCGDNPGIVGILGSGSNAAFYTGKSVKANNYGLGFILNDEGSANWLGRRLLKAYLTETMPASFRNTFQKKFTLDRKQILDKVYKQPQPVLFLASFSEFLHENRNHEYVSGLVKEGFSLYFENYIMPLAQQYPDAPLHFAGTVASGFEDQLREAAASRNLAIKSIVKAPLNRVLNYYTHKN